MKVKVEVTLISSLYTYHYPEKPGKKDLRNLKSE